MPQMQVVADQVICWTGLGYVMSVTTMTVHQHCITAVHQHCDAQL